MTFWRRLAIALVVAVSGSVLKADATRVTPMAVELDETGSGSSTRIEVSNTDEEDLPIEVRVFSADISEQGEPVFTPADEDFLVFPPQAIVEPGRAQVFRLQYLGDEPLVESKVYYMSVRQVPVDLDPGVSKIQIVTTFNVLVNVVPPGARPNVSVDWARPVQKDGVDGVEVRLVNDGTKYLAAGRESWRISGRDASGGSVSQVYRGRSVGDKIGYGIVAPGKARIFFVPTDDAFEEVTDIQLGN